MPVTEKISDLPTGSALNTGDYIPYVDNSGTPTTRKMSKQTLVASLGSATSGWNSLGVAPATVTALGNRSYSIVFNSIDISTFTNPGHRLRFTRTVAAPTQATSMNGTNHFWNKTSPAAMTYTDDFTVSAWIRLSSYNGADNVIASRWNGTSGWQFRVTSSGNLLMAGYNGGAANNSYVSSYQSVPVNKWVHVTAQLDMSAFTATTTTSYIMIDGVDVPALVARGGTNPTALVQAGNLEIGSTNAGTLPFNGKIAQVAIYNAKVTQATILASIHQTLAGTETSLISAYSFNGNASDLNTTNANNLTSNNGVAATDASSPFGGQASGSVSSTLDYGIIQKITFSTNSTVIVQVPEGCTIPTSGSVASVDYATVKAPYGMPMQRGKWCVSHIQKVSITQGSAVAGTWYNLGNQQLNLPVGEWVLDYQTSPVSTATSSTITYQTVSTGAATESDPEFTTQYYQNASATAGSARYRQRPVSVTAAAAPYYLNTKQAGGSSVTLFSMDTSPSILEAENAYL